jgi:hypothetical protein
MTIVREGADMIARVFLALAIGAALTSALLLPAMAEPAAEADLNGKKICWSNGNISSFLPDGKYSSPVIGDGTWTWTAKGVDIHTPMLVVRLDVDKQPDGTFKSKIEGATGKYCE